jgi:hypothetical protein
VTIEQDIVKWSTSRPSWQQEILRTLAQGQIPDRAAIEALAERLIKGHHNAVAPLTVADMPRAQAATPKIQLDAIKDIENVNGLLDAQGLTFAKTGLTVVYGDNASGKSGYARVIKSVVGARHQEAVHPNVFSDSTGQPQKAVIAFDENDVSSIATWPEAVRVGDYVPTVRTYDA